jgi:hypothetical protein
MLTNQDQQQQHNNNNYQQQQQQQININGMSSIASSVMTSLGNTNSSQISSNIDQNLNRIQQNSIKASPSTMPIGFMPPSTSGGTSSGMNAASNMIMGLMQSGLMSPNNPAIMPSPATMAMSPQLSPINSPMPSPFIGSPSNPAKMVSGAVWTNVCF